MKIYRLPAINTNMVTLIHTCDQACLVALSLFYCEKEF